MFTIITKYAPGEHVRLTPLNVGAVVNQIVVGAGETFYDCFWWYDGERRSSCLTEGEIAKA